METLGLSDSTPKTRSWILELLWPTVNSEVAAETAARNGLWVCFVIGVLSAFVVAASIRFSPAGLLIAIVVLFYFLLLGVGVGAGSRVAALAAILYQLFSFALGLMIGQAGNPVVVVIAVGLLVGSLRAAVALRKFRREAASSTTPPDLPESVYRESAPEHLRRLAEADERGLINRAIRVWRRVTPGGELLLGSLTLLFFGLMTLGVIMQMTHRVPRP